MEDNQNPNFNFTVGSNWNEQKEKLKEQYPQLTDADLHCDRGQEQELFARLETKLEKNPNEISQIFNQLNTHNSPDSNLDDQTETTF